MNFVKRYLLPIILVVLTLGFTFTFSIVSGTWIVFWFSFVAIIAIISIGLFIKDRRNWKTWMAPASLSIFAIALTLFLNWGTLSGWFDFSKINIKGDLTAKNITATEDVNAGKDVNAGNNVNAKNDVNAGNNVNAKKDVNAGNNINAEKDLHVKGNATVDGNLEVGGDTHLKGDLEVDGDTHMKGDLNVDGDVNVGGDINKKPTQPPVQPTQPTKPTQPTQPPVQPTQPPVQPTQPPVQPTQPPVQPTQPPVQPTQPPVQPTQPPAPAKAVASIKISAPQDGFKTIGVTVKFDKTVSNPEGQVNATFDKKMVQWDGTMLYFMVELPADFTGQYTVYLSGTSEWNASSQTITIN